MGPDVLLAILIIAAFVAFDLLAVEFGADTREGFDGRDTRRW